MKYNCNSERLLITTWLETQYCRVDEDFRGGALNYAIYHRTDRSHARKVKKIVLSASECEKKYNYASEYKIDVCALGPRLRERSFLTILTYKAIFTLELSTKVNRKRKMISVRKRKLG